MIRWWGLGTETSTVLLPRAELGQQVEHLLRGYERFRPVRCLEQQSFFAPKEPATRCLDRTSSAASTVSVLPELDGNGLRARVDPRNSERMGENPEAGEFDPAFRRLRKESEA